MVGNLYADGFSKEKDPISVFLIFILGFSAKNRIICVSQNIEDQKIFYILQTFK